MDVGKKIAIIGAGFSGTSLAAILSRFTTQPLEITLFDKTGHFGAGDAYRTPYSWHILNVRARDMSVFEDQPAHFVDWVSARQSDYEEVNQSLAIGEQFLPRYIYHHYLCDLLKQLQSGANKNLKINFVAAEVIDAKPIAESVSLATNDHQTVQADKVVLAIGNQPPLQFPFDVSGVDVIANPWDYEMIDSIPADADVMIAGMGLTMIDTVITLYEQQHRGKIYAISRRGILPQPHTDTQMADHVDLEEIKFDLRSLTKALRLKSMERVSQGGDWRSIVNAVRMHAPVIWENASLADKKRFMRHVLPYWNVHRHRVHSRLMVVLNEMVSRGQLVTMAGRIESVNNKMATVRLRQDMQRKTIPIDWLVNCMGPGMNAQKSASHLERSLIATGCVAYDPLSLGFAATKDGEVHDASGSLSPYFYTLGPPAKGTVWECTAVPEIRKQGVALAKKILGD